GKLPIDVPKIGCDLLSISGHKMHAPQGIGALYVRKGTLIRPMLFGGSHERQRRAGTENVPAIVGFGKAAQIAVAAFEDGEVARLEKLRNRLQQAVLSEVAECEINGGDATRGPHRTNVRFGPIQH